MASEDPADFPADLFVDPSEGLDQKDVSSLISDSLDFASKPTPIVQPQPVVKNPSEYLTSSIQQNGQQQVAIASARLQEAVQAQQLVQQQQQQLVQQQQQQLVQQQQKKQQQSTPITIQPVPSPPKQVTVSSPLPTHVAQTVPTSAIQMSQQLLAQLTQQQDQQTILSDQAGTIQLQIQPTPLMQQKKIILQPGQPQQIIISSPQPQQQPQIQTNIGQLSVQQLQQVQQYQQVNLVLGVYLVC